MWPHPPHIVIFVAAVVGVVAATADSYVAADVDAAGIIGTGVSLFYLLCF